MNKILIVGGETAIRWIRLELPIKLMGGVEYKIVKKVVEEDLEQGYNLVYYNRVMPENLLSEIFKLREKWKFKLIIDNDDYWVFNKKHPIYDWAKKARNTEYIQLGIKYADACTVTHERLAEEVSKLNKNVYILPNAIPDIVNYHVVKERHENKLKFFYAGGSSHAEDLRLLKPTMKLIYKDHNLKKLYYPVFCGNKNHPITDDMINSFTLDLKLKGSIRDHVNYEKFYKYYSWCDVSLIPLVSNKFNSFKSNLKVLEAAHCESPVIVSKVHPYLDFPKELVNFVEDNNWLPHIKSCILDFNYYQQQAKVLKRWCEINFNYDKINNVRKDILTNI